ncbi:MAG: preprotein translocase subunit TatC [Thermodesulfobacteria bacterium]|nr:preprotein translocase subunit TatC [Thermodesulfobacteriota bacterium]
MERPNFTVLTHFDELRKRLLIFIGFLFLVWVVLFSQFSRLVPFFVWPYHRAFPSRELDLVFTTLPEAIMAALKSTFFLALALSLPLLLFQAWRFLSPALYEHEKKALRKVIFLVTIFALGGMALAYLLILPTLLKLFLGMGYARFTPYLRVQSYLSFLGKGLLVAAVVAQLPAVVALLLKAGLIPAQVRHKRFFYLAGGAYLVALFISPADIVSQIILAAAFYLLMELGFLLARLF